MRFLFALLVGLSLSAGCSIGDDDDDSASPTPSATATASAEILVSEIAVQPSNGEFIEIWNAGSAEIDLSSYYLTDESSYTSLAAGDPWSPTGTPQSDFLAQFPAGTTIAADAVLVVAFTDQYENQYGSCPDLVMAAAGFTCNATTVPPMVAPTNGGIGNNAVLGNAEEMVMLFTWSGDTADNLYDIDYVTWGVGFDDDGRVDKSGETGYLSDTPRANQDPAPPPANNESLERCSLETGETTTGGNGITGHDETSESMSTTFVIQSTPSPGTKNTCL